MKKLIFATILILTFFSSCGTPGETTQVLRGDEMNLPEELKGLEVYEVDLGPEGFIYVATLDNNINSLKYSKGKNTEEVLILATDKTQRMIQIKNIISENDSVIVCRK